MNPRKVTVLGATGSVGQSTLDLIGRTPEQFEIVALTAGTNAESLAELAIKHRAKHAALADPSQFGKLKKLLAGTGIEASAGEDAVCDAARIPADWIMAAIVGAAGLRPTFAAATQGTCVALANKECLVSAGEVFLSAIKAAGTRLLPVDSEHSAAFQAIDGSPSRCIEFITLTASGGPFRDWSAAQLKAAKPEQALKHPNWSMGRKITIDSATLMNKGLEIIEAYHLFPVEVDQLRVLVHPQSIIHCLVQYCDGSVIAQMSAPDMRTPIAYSLSWPERMAAPTERLDLVKLAQLTFEAADETRFPALRIAREALQAGGIAPTVLNAANEIAVESFLAGQIGFMTIPTVVEAALEASLAEYGTFVAKTLDDVLEADRAARALATRLCAA
ncbi:MULTISPECIES: 1-deoxy-D-xylulose-5-phosphate reductoisomerase [Rhodomicrobium]|uniref:1-deoxy-D-xylulose-5-phosphate reductoisomerase n=1 Tax=Rhodomicrobium TaxID=1068 RepID=UPI000B4C1318|nr:MULTISPECIES: 1-deoxy-D-xylulose-5-phosphate reductoisomerase [Rhodomicrobium]